MYCIKVTAFIAAFLSSSQVEEDMSLGTIDYIEERLNLSVRNSWGSFIS